MLEGDGDLTVRIRGVLLGWLDVAEPYHRFAAQFFKNAADPDSPLSPFSEDSAAARDAAISIHERCIAGADVKSDPELAPLLPQLMWLMQMGLVLFWVYDRSEGAERSHAAGRAHRADRRTRHLALPVPGAATARAADPRAAGGVPAGSAADDGDRTPLRPLPPRPDVPVRSG